MRHEFEAGKNSDTHVSAIYLKFPRNIALDLHKYAIRSILSVIEKDREEKKNSLTLHIRQFVFTFGDSEIPVTSPDEIEAAALMPPPYYQTDDGTHGWKEREAFAEREETFKNYLRSIESGMVSRAPVEEEFTDESFDRSQRNIGKTELWASVDQLEVMIQLFSSIFSDASYRTSRGI